MVDPKDAAQNMTQAERDRRFGQPHHGHGQQAAPTQKYSNPPPTHSTPKVLPPGPQVRCAEPGSDFQTALQAAVDNDGVLTLNGNIQIDAPVSIRINRSNTGWFGLDGGKHKIVSNVQGQPAIRFFMDDAVPSGTCARSLVVSDIAFMGNGGEESALQIDVGYNDRWVVNPMLQNLWFEGCGGRGALKLMGSIFEGNLYSVGTMNSRSNGVYLSQLESGGGGKGILSAMRWYGGTQRQNAGHGILYDGYDGPHDMRLYGLYFCENHGNGINAVCGLELVDACGFENNNDAAIYVENFATLRKCTGSTWGPQPYLAKGYVVGDMRLDSCSVAGYNGGSPRIGQFSGGGTVTAVGTDPGLLDVNGPRLITGA